MDSNQSILDFMKLAFGAFITILNVWMVWIVTDLKNDLRELRGWLVNKLTEEGKKSDYPRPKKQVEKDPV